MAKIAIIIERADITLGGAERSVFELASALSALGHQVDVLAAKGSPNARTVRILCPEYSGKRVGLEIFSKAPKKHLRDNAYDIVHSILPFDFADVYQPRGGTVAESIVRNASSYENRVIELYKRLTACANFRRTALLNAEKRLCKNSGCLVAALSEYVAEQFRSHYDLPAERLIVIHNGIKVNRSSDPEQAGRLRGQILRQLRITEAVNPVLLLFAANNFRLKGLAPLIRALAKAAQQRTERPLYLIVAGRGSSSRYRHLAKRLNAHKRIVFLGKLHNIQNAISISDVAVLPTFYDPSSRFILEALAAGKPVITTSFNGAVDLFEDGRHGKVVDSPQNTNALCEAITYFASTDNINKAAQRIVDDNLKQNVSINRVAAELNKLYESVIKKREK